MIHIRVFNTYPPYRNRPKETISIAARVLKKERISAGELNIVFISDRRMIRLNNDFLRHRRTTDVISFPLATRAGRRVEGEIYINVQQAKRQSKEFAVSLKEEIARLVIHGVLHLAGYDDKTRKEKSRMTRLENAHLGLDPEG